MLPAADPVLAVAGVLVNSFFYLIGVYPVLTVAEVIGVFTLAPIVIFLYNSGLAIGPPPFTGVLFYELIGVFYLLGVVNSSFLIGVLEFELLGLRGGVFYYGITSYFILLSY